VGEEADWVAEGVEDAVCVYSVWPDWYVSPGAGVVVLLVGETVDATLDQFR
jgi:hypothetical protein